MKMKNHNFEGSWVKIGSTYSKDVAYLVVVHTVDKDGIEGPYITTYKDGRYYTKTKNIGRFYWSEMTSMEQL